MQNKQKDTLAARRRDLSLPLLTKQSNNKTALDGAAYFNFDPQAQRNATNSSPYMQDGSLREQAFGTT